MTKRLRSGDPRDFRKWNLQDAKARLSELVDRCVVGEPQVIFRRGQPAVVVLPFAEFERKRGPRESLLSFLQRSPLAQADLELDRSRESIKALRDLEL